MFILKQYNNIIMTAGTSEELQEKQVFFPDSSIEKSNIEYIYYDNEFLTKEEIALKEQDKINRLTMTALDFVNYIKKAGVSDEVILQYLQANPSIQLQLTLCQNVYCGVVRQLCPLKITDTLTLTDEMVVAFFKKKRNIE
nr:MAG TPA: hypothetical protein [Caudoviricetes sp.]